MTTRTFTGIILAGLLLGASGATADSFMGEYTGTFFADSRVQIPATASVVAEDSNKWRIVIAAGAKDSIELYGNLAGSRVHVAYPSGGYEWYGGIQDGRLSVRSAYGQHFELDKIVRKSPNEGLKPPASAVVLLPYKKGAKPDLGAWTNQNWKALDSGAMQVNKGTNATKERFGDIKHLHIEFKLPLEPRNRGQGRGNSGVYLCGTYEVQVLDSFGLVHTSGDCGGLYNLKRADVNACLPPETWQTYDIEFRAPRLNDDGTIKENARVTVRHNGITIHDNVEIPRPTANPKAEQRTTGPILLQDHSHPVQYRNIWLVKD
ncbi:MAG: DUF1080 domain-containing protein [Sedimentisphaerales bacterium]|nr:DUF1080 domain-containing protein [Sedimentisphaerales bacterium]